MNEKLSLIQRFFTNKYSRADYFQLKELLLDQESELEELMQKHWQEFVPDNQQQKKDLSEIISIINKNSKTYSLKKLFPYYSKIAAILILPLTIALTFLYFQFDQYLSQKKVYVEVNSPSGSRTFLKLPDGSAVWLNGNSQIRYPVVFNENRHVKIKGEAFFHVKSDKKHPFIVATDEILVRATGTEFNVSDYATDPDVRVILKKGIVAVMDTHHSILKNMEENYQLKYNKKTSAINYLPFNAKDYADWIHGRLIFEDAPMSEVVRRMGRWYGVNIKIIDKELLNLHFKATFTNESIDEALKLLQSTATFNYRVAKRQIRQDGSYDDSEIDITKRKE